MGIRAASGAQALANELQRPASPSAYWVASALASMGPAAVPPLTSALSNGSAEARYWAAWALSRTVPVTPEAVSALSQALTRDADTNVRLVASSGLGRMGGDAAAARAALEQAASDDADAGVRARAEKALDDIGEAP